MKLLSTLSLLGLLLLANPVFSQRTCGTTDHMEHLHDQDPTLRDRMQAIEDHTQNIIRNNNFKGVSGILSIPVVVHVVYKTAEQNISDAQVLSQIDVLNEDFRRLNADASNTPSDFLGVAADIEVEFYLATNDPSSQPTDGITRTTTTVSSFSSNDNMKFTASGGIDAWPTDTYLNIWVCNLTGGLLGYAQFPGGPAATDGIVCGYQYFGTGGTATPPFDLGRTATHEVGHWLNLRHIWGDGGCSVDDFVSDTPIASGPNYTGSTCNYPGRNSCNEGAGDLPDMFQNYMDYSDDGCMNLFTTGQKQRMRALFDTGGARENLPSSICNDVTLFTQAEVDAFSCASITGNLTIGDPYGSSDITNLNALSSLTSVGLNLNISEISGLTNFDSLYSLTSVGGSIVINENDALTNLDGLSSLSTVGLDLAITYNGALSNFDSLYSLTSVGGSMVINGNDALTNLDGLSSLSSVGLDLAITANGALANFDSLYSLTSVGGSMVINGNDALTNLDGLSSLTTVGLDLAITHNGALTNFDSLYSLESVGRNLDIFKNNVLTNFDSLNSLTSVGGRLYIRYNDVLTNLDGLSSLTSVGTNLTISYNDALTNLDGLSRLTSVEGYLYIINNSTLTEFCGLYPLLSGGGLFDWYHVEFNASNPTEQQIIDGGHCLVGDLVINEIMNNPAAVYDNEGEWFEVYNTSDSDIDMIGMTIRDDDSDSFEIATSLVVPAGGYVVLGPNADAGANGGVAIDYEYVYNNFYIANGADEVVIEAFESIIDQVSYDNGATFPDPNGASMSLDPGSQNTTDNDIGANWCEASSAFGDGDLGTPGAENDVCNTPPTAVCKNVTVSADVSCQATVSASDVDNGSSDPDGDEITMTLSPEGPYELGETIVTLTVTDPSGASAVCTATIMVEDDTEPELIVITNPIVLWPPNHKYETIDMSQLVVSVDDNCDNLSIDDVYITSVTSDEVEDAKGGGDGKTKDDIVIASDCQSVDLRKERSGKGNGRVYSIFLEVMDANGNAITAKAQVHVPHNNGGTAIDDGMAYEEECGDKSSFAAFSGDDIELTNYPNPFNGKTTISFTLTESDETTLKVYDTFGKEVATLFNGMAEAGQQYTVEFKGENLSKGIYVYHLQSGNNVSVVKKMILMK